MHTLRLFREAFAKRRALIPATGFFEWQKRADGKQPYRFQQAAIVCLPQSGTMFLRPGFLVSLFAPLRGEIEPS